ncbi:MAG: hypothetical protein ACXAC5_10450 [Promethearchaeota archaeon]|jgi:hypothetical protein
MVLPNIDIINGVTGLEIILSGYILAFILFLKHARKAPNAIVQKKIILRGIGLFSVFQAWFGVSASFILILLGLNPLGYPDGDPNVGVLGYAWGPALGIPIWTYVALDTYKESSYKKKVRTLVTIFMAILSLIFAILIYTNPSGNTKWEASPGGLPETGIRGLALALLFVMLVTMMIFLGPTIIYSGLKMEDKSAKWRRYSLGIGLTMASLFGIIDAAFGAEDFGLIGLAIVKAFIFTSIFLIYQGVDKGT